MHVRSMGTSPLGQLRSPKNDLSERVLTREFRVMLRRSDKEVTRLTVALEHIVFGPGRDSNGQLRRQH